MLYMHVLAAFALLRIDFVSLHLDDIVVLAIKNSRLKFTTFNKLFSNHGQSAVLILWIKLEDRCGRTKSGSWQILFESPISP